MEELNNIRQSVAPDTAQQLVVTNASLYGTVALVSRLHV